MTGAELRHMKAFLEVARCGSFTRAAEELHICQPALTVQIKQLEHALGVRLFDRDKRHVALTQVGRELVRPVERVIADVESIRVSSQEFATHQRGIVTVAVLPSIAAGVLPGAIRQLTVNHPGVAVRIVELIGTRVADAVKAGEVDLGIGSYARIDRELTYQHLWSDRMAAFVPVQHPLAKRRAVTFREVASYPLILTRRDSSVRILVDRMLERERLSVNVVLEASYVSTLTALVAVGLGISILPEREFTPALETSIRMLPIRSPALVRNIGIIGNAGRSFSPAAEKFADVLRLSVSPPLRPSAAPVRPRSPSPASARPRPPSPASARPRRNSPVLTERVEAGRNSPVLTERGEAGRNPSVIAERVETGPPPPSFGPSTLREPQGRPEHGRGTTSSGSSRAQSRDGEARRQRGSTR